MPQSPPPVRRFASPPGDRALPSDRASDALRPQPSGRGAQNATTVNATGRERRSRPPASAAGGVSDSSAPSSDAAGALPPLGEPRPAELLAAEPAVADAAAAARRAAVGDDVLLADVLSLAARFEVLPAGDFDLPQDAAAVSFTFARGAALPEGAAAARPHDDAPNGDWPQLPVRFCPRPCANPDFPAPPRPANPTRTPTPTPC